MSDDRGAPDYKLATIIMWLVTGANVARTAGVGYETVERARLLLQEIYDAINVRGARVGELVDAIRSVRRHGSIIEDLPTVREKLPPRSEE